MAQLAVVFKRIGASSMDARIRVYSMGTRKRRAMWPPKALKAACLSWNAPSQS